MWPRDKNLGMAVMFFDAGCFPLLLLPAWKEEGEIGGISIWSFGGFNWIVRFLKGSHKDQEHGNAPTNPPEVYVEPSEALNHGYYSN